MVTVSCTKCGTQHEVDATKLGWSVLCADCRPTWGMKHRGWMRERHKEMVRKRKREIRMATHGR